VNENENENGDVQMVRIVEVDERRDWHRLVLDVLVVQDCLDCLLNFHGWETLVVFCRTFRHVEVQLEDVVKLVARVKISETLCDAGVLRGRSLHAHCTLRPLRASLNVAEGVRVTNSPVIHFLVPLSNLLVLLVLFWWNEVLDDHVFELELIRELVNGVVHIVSLTVKVLVYLS